MDRADGTVEWAAIAHRKGRAVRGGGRATQHTAIVCDRPPRNCRTVAIQLSTYNTIPCLLCMVCWCCHLKVACRPSCTMLDTLRVINLLLPYNCSASVVSCSAPISLSVDCGGANGPNAKLAQSGTAVSRMQLPVWHTANHTGTGLGHRQRLAVSSVCGPCLGLR